MAAYSSQLILDVDRAENGLWEIVVRFDPESMEFAYTDQPSLDFLAEDLGQAIVAALKADEANPEPPAYKEAT